MSQPEYDLLPNPVYDRQNTGDPFTFVTFGKGNRRTGEPPEVLERFIRVRVDGSRHYKVDMKAGEKPFEAMERFKKEKESHTDPRQGLRPGDHPHKHLFDSHTDQDPKYPNEKHIQEMLYGKRQEPREPAQHDEPPDEGGDNPRKVGRPRKQGAGE